MDAQHEVYYYKPLHLMSHWAYVWRTIYKFSSNLNFDKMLTYRKILTLLLSFKPCRLLIHAWRHAYLLLLESIYRLKATLKIIMSVQWIYMYYLILVSIKYNFYTFLYFL